MTRRFHTLGLIIPGDTPPRVFDFLTETEPPGHLSADAVRVGHIDHGDWKITWMTETPITPDQMAEILHSRAAVLEVNLPPITPAMITAQTIEDCNWLERSFRGFAPFTIGRFHLRGQHDRDTAVPAGLIPMVIDAVTAFGSGEHPTTRGCLVAIDQIAQTGFTPQKILDLGTGSGILAISAQKLWPAASITAVDNDPESVRVATAYAGYNGIKTGPQPGQIDCRLGDTPGQDDIAARGPFDVIVANILAGPLQELAPAIAAALAPGGRLILSGLLVTQIDDVMESYRSFGFKQVAQEHIDDWAALRLERI